MKKTKLSALLVTIFAISVQSSATEIVTILASQQENPSVHSSSQRVVIKSVYKEGIYSFSVCEQVVTFQDKKISSSMEVINCRTLGSPNGYTDQQVRDRLQQMNREIRNERLADVASIAVAVVAGAGVGAYPSVKYIRKATIGKGGIADQFKTTKDFNKSLWLSHRLDYEVGEFMVRDLLGRVLGGAAGGSVMGYFVWGSDLLEARDALGQTLTPQSKDVSTFFIELDDSDMLQLSRQLNVILAGID